MTGLTAAWMTSREYAATPANPDFWHNSVTHRICKLSGVPINVLAFKSQTPAYFDRARGSKDIRVPNEPEMIRFATSSTQC